MVLLIKRNIAKRTSFRKIVGCIVSLVRFVVHATKLRVESLLILGEAEDVSATYIILWIPWSISNVFDEV